MYRFISLISVQLSFEYETVIVYELIILCIVTYIYIYDDGELKLCWFWKRFPCNNHDSIVSEVKRSIY